MPNVRKCITCRYAYFKKGPYQYPTENRPYRFKCAIMHFVTRKDRLTSRLDIDEDYCPLVYPYKDTINDDRSIKDVEKEAVLRMYRCGYLSNNHYESSILRNANVDKDLPVVYDYTFKKEYNLKQIDRWRCKKFKWPKKK